MLLKGTILRHLKNPTVMLNYLCERAVGLELCMAGFIYSVNHRTACVKWLASSLLQFQAQLATRLAMHILNESSHNCKLHILYEQCEFK